MTTDIKIAMIGSGSWATALVKILCENTGMINWWIRDSNMIDHLNVYGRNPKYLPSAQLDPAKLNMSTDLVHVIESSDILIMVVPSAYIHDVFKDIDPSLMRGKILFSSVKGMVQEYNTIPARYFKKHFGMPYRKLGIICGPCHAEEVAMERLSYLTVASKSKRKAKYLAKLLRCRYIKTHVTEDVIGSEIATAMKNVFAIASGIADGLGYGDNFQAVLVSNAIMEMERFLDEVKSIHRDVKTSAYLGDLLVTAYSHFSRNRNFGHMIGRGYKVRTAMLEMNMVAEGYYAVNGLMVMNKKYQADIPITRAVHEILYEGRPASNAILELTDHLK